MTLRKEFQDYMDARTKIQVPAPWEMTTQEFRRLTLPNVDFIGIPEPIYSVEHRFISGPTAYLPTRIYRPSAEKNLPVLVYFHGGGWVIGNQDGSEPTVRGLANKGNFVVVAIQYQKAPENRFPIPFDDCYSALEWVVENANELGIDPSAIGVGGDSAGGNLAAAVAIKCRDTKLTKLAFQMLVYPVTGHDFTQNSYITNAEGYGLTTKVMKWFVQQYIGKPEDLENPYAFPAMSKDLSNLAPTVLVTADHDPLADDGRLYAEALANAGVKVIFKEYEGVVHGFNALAGAAKEVFDDGQYFLTGAINEFLGRK